MVQLNDFGVSVKKRLIDLNQNQAWLMEQVRQKTGKYIDSSYLNKLFTDRAASEPMVQAIKEILEI